MAHLSKQTVVGLRNEPQDQQSVGGRQQIDYFHPWTEIRRRFVLAANQSMDF
jgi:hypothetical protein